MARRDIKPLNKREKNQSYDWEAGPMSRILRLPGAVVKN